MVNREGCQLRLCKAKRGRRNVTEGIKGWHIQTRYGKNERHSKGVDKCDRYFRAGGGYGAASYLASKPVCKWVHYRGLMLMLGLGRSAALCNMLKLMRCNKWTNPPKARPLWQKREAFRQARRCLCLSRRQAWSSQRVSVSLREGKKKPQTWLIVGDVCPAPPPRVQGVSLVGAGAKRSACGESNVRKRAVADSMCSSRGLTGKHLVRIRSVLQHVHSYTHGWKQVYLQSHWVVITWISGKKKKSSYLHVNQTLKLPPATAVASHVFPHS